MPFKRNICINRRWYPGPLLLKVRILLLVLFISLTGCQTSGEDQPDITFDWGIEPSPPRVGETTINLTLRDSTGHLISGADIKLEGNMSHPGMKPVITTAKQQEPGKYTADFEFTMAGDWFIIVTTSLGDSSQVEKQIKIPGVRAQ